MIINLDGAIKKLSGAIDDLDPQGNNSYVSQHKLLLVAAEKLHSDAIISLSAALIGDNLDEILTLLQQIKSMLTDLCAIKEITIPQDSYEDESKTISEWDKYVILEQSSQNLAGLADKMTGYIEEMFYQTVHHLVTINNSVKIKSLQNNLKKLHNGKEIFALITEVLNLLAKDFVYLSNIIKIYKTYVEPIAQQYRQKVGKSPLHTLRRKPPAISLTEGVCSGDALLVSDNVDRVFEFKLSEAFQHQAKYEEKMLGHQLYDVVKFTLNKTHPNVADFIYAFVNGQDIHGHPALNAGIETDTAFLAFAQKDFSIRSCRIILNNPEDHVISIVQFTENGITKIYLRDLNSGVYDV